MAAPLGIRIEDILRLKQEGMKNADIARHFGCSDVAIGMRLDRWAKRNGMVPLPDIAASETAFLRFTEAAKARGITTAALLSRLIETAATGGPNGASMIDAILDDETE